MAGDLRFPPLLHFIGLEADKFLQANPIVEDMLLARLESLDLDEVWTLEGVLTPETAPVLMKVLPELAPILRHVLQCRGRSRI